MGFQRQLRDSDRQDSQWQPRRWRGLEHLDDRRQQGRRSTLRFDRLRWFWAESPLDQLLNISPQKKASIQIN